MGRGRKPRGRGFSGPRAALRIRNFSCSSVLGTWMAALVGMGGRGQWRYAYLVGVLPPLLILWVRARVREPEKWQAKAAEAKNRTRGWQLGSFRAC